MPEQDQGLLTPWGVCPNSPLGVASDVVAKLVGVSITGEQKIRLRIPFDLLLDGVHAIVLDQNGDPTLAWSWNWRFTRSEDWAFYTAGAEGRGARVEASGTVSFGTEPFYWCAPKVARKTETLEIKIAPDAGTTLTYVNIAFSARRLRGREAEIINCIDPTQHGYVAMAFPKITVDHTGIVAGNEGPEFNAQLDLDSLRYDFLMNQMSVLDVDPLAVFPSGPSATLVEHLSVVRSRYVGGGSRHDHAFSGVVSQRYGGRRGDASPLGFRRVAADLPATMRFHEQSHVEVFAASLRAAGGAPLTWQVRIIMHGQRIPSEGLPSYLGYPSITIPPGSHDPRFDPS